MRHIAMRAALCGLLTLTTAVSARSQQNDRSSSAPSSVRQSPDAAVSITATAPAADLATLLENIREKYKLPALGCAVVRSGALSASAVTGKRTIDADAPVTTDDQWHIGSDSKAMTATVIGMLIDQRRLDWHTTLADVFPELRETMHTAYCDVTVEQLLWHRGGFPGDLKEGGLWEKLGERQGTPTQQRRVLLEGVLSRPPAAPPGTKFIYSNAGYAAAGAMAEKVTGQSWEELMRTMLFEPLAMKSAGFGAPGTAPVSVASAPSAAEIDQPWGHLAGMFGNLTPVPPGPLADNPPALAPAGTVHCSLADWARFVALHLRGARGELTPAQAKLIGAETIRRLQTPPQDLQAPSETGEYACGWAVVQRSWGGRVLTHAGSNTMWFAVVWLAPQKDFAVLVTTNAGGPTAERAADEASGELVKRVISEQGS
jgi:CubicO group peptidase (beta-lactamase class C family)